MVKNMIYFISRRINFSSMINHSAFLKILQVKLVKQVHLGCKGLLKESKYQIKKIINLKLAKALSTNISK